MLSYLSMAGNQAVDDYAINTCGIPGSVLMENAGHAVVREMLTHGFLRSEQHILVLTGKGNNAGDGYVIAADLISRGFQPVILSVINVEQVRGVAGQQLGTLLKLNPLFQVWDNLPSQQQLIQEADIIIDALLGTGTKGELRQPYIQIIKLCNQASARIVAVDVPSGVSGDEGHILDPCIKAHLTISMGFGKRTCLFEPARSHCGLVVPVDIGFPADSLAHCGEQALHLLQTSDFPTGRFSRQPDAHKYNSGKVFIIAGSRGFSGAAILAAKAALRSGAGLVRLAVPESIGAIAETASLETIVNYLPETDAQSLSTTGYQALMDACAWADVVALGPGIGRHPETIQLAQLLIREHSGPLVIDADGLFALAQDPELLKQRGGPTILTPHAGEFKRLAQLAATHTPTWQDALNFACSNQVYVLLKGAPSLLACPEGQVFVNATGYAGMATAGSGDVLTGIIASLWSQWDKLPDVFNFAMYIHGQAADLQRDKKGVLGLVAGDIIAALPLALKEYGGIPD